MNRLPHIWLLALVVALSGLAAGSVHAAPQDHDRADRVYQRYQDRKSEEGRRDREDEERVKVSLDQAVNAVRRQKGGKVIGTKTERRGKSVTYRIRVLHEDGKVRNYSVDAKSGSIR